ncbi:8-oxoguanine DNA glycosylase OGG fold protein [Streptomyces sp. IBSBF 2390]|uniref:8-oxoguanine DNA glycosylase OGG fold protein n=1 Tax=Streptomyces sp. IBSBF 2390 TaxID=2903533 RepID=UPI002FDC4DC1
MPTRFNQSLADNLDAAMLEFLLPEEAVESLSRWLADPGRGKRYAHGTGPHAIAYAPSSWTAVAPWPLGLANRGAHGSARVSRADVVAIVTAAKQSENWTEAFVATQVWGYGLRGYGPHRTGKVLAQPGARNAITESVSLLVDDGAIAAYDRLNTLDGLGPAFLTKFLYFLGLALPEVKGPSPLILDSVLAGVLRRQATKIGQTVGYEWSEAIANRIWRDGTWTSHRYGVYLRWMCATNQRLGDMLIDWPAAPDVLELALFSGAWDPA